MRVELTKVPAIVIKGVGDEKDKEVFHIQIFKSGYKNHVNVIYEDPYECVEHHHLTVEGLKEKYPQIGETFINFLVGE